MPLRKLYPSQSRLSPKTRLAILAVLIVGPASLLCLSLGLFGLLSTLSF